MRLIVLIDVLQVFALDQALETLVFAVRAREECRWSVVLRTVDSQCTLGKLLRRIEQESLINDLFIDVTFHVDGCSIFLFLVDQAGDDVESRRIVLSPNEV